MNPGRAYNEGYISRDLFISIGMQKAQRRNIMCQADDTTSDTPVSPSALQSDDSAEAELPSTDSALAYADGWMDGFKEGGGANKYDLQVQIDAAAFNLALEKARNAILRDALKIYATDGDAYGEAARAALASAQRPDEEPKQSEGDTTDHLANTVA